MAEEEQGFAAFEAELNAARAALEDFSRNAAQSAADDVGAAFERAGERISAALGRAAARGEVSFKNLAKVVLEEFAKIALDQIFSNSGAKQSPNFFGARAAGGSVTTGGAYLVGERGPELFTPAQSGRIGAAESGAVNVHFHFAEGSDASAVARHQGQIAAQIARAVAYGRRNL